MIQDIITAINSSIQNCLDVENSVYYNLASTVSVNDELYPVVPIDGKLKKICFNDNIDLQIYHKIDRDQWTSNEVDPSDSTGGYGRNITYGIEARSKMIVILKSKLSEFYPAYNPLNFLRLLPQTVTVADYNNIFIIKNTVISDHDTIVDREWKRTDYTKHKCKFLVFEVNYTIRALTCKLECASFLLLEDSFKLLQESGSAILV
jgi:hypothetical protein